MYHCEVRLTFSLRFKQTIELHPDVNLSSYSSAVPFQYKNTIFSGAVHRNFIKFTCCIEFNALSNAISLLTGINLQSIYVNFKRDMS